MKKKEVIINNFVIISDTFGNVLQIISRGEFERKIKAGDNLCNFVNIECSYKYFQFLEIVKREGYILGYEIDFYSNGVNCNISLNGFFENDRIYIIGLFNSPEIDKILKDVLKMNSLYINQLRSNIKNYYMDAGEFDEIAYTEISRLNNELINSKRIIEQQNAKLLEYTKSLEELALKDSLTGAYNRRYFNQRMNEELEKLKKINSKIVLTSIDLDNFKIVNDKLGHLAGDELLQKFAIVCKNSLRKDLDLVFRLGGDEFVIISLEEDIETAVNNIEKINIEFKKYTEISELSYGIIGITTENINDKFNFEDCLKEVDQKMYLFKRKKKDGGSYKVY